ncbi:hypothetical protein [Streptomyces sp. SID13031]|uniref:hypothetical protein n=1 Tax=Streptomyces sp. SID13031 TaxID=2706046 RepID=UPI0013C65335|nr:hypothetical protein [Streptomyces sp. SID13031]NEA31256.1 hypothetical protein [Streptomyces sp. SID13031]
MSGKPYAVERVIGTVMRLVHDEVPGTTFSNVAQRGAYDSDGKAVMTLAELNAWLVLAVACYHGQVQEAQGRIPAAVWTELAERDGTPATTSNVTAFVPGRLLAGDPPHAVTQRVPGRSRAALLRRAQALDRPASSWASSYCG